MLTKETQLAKNTGIYADIDELIHLRFKKNAPLNSLRKSVSQIVGENSFKIRGRGIEFDSTREYQAGDDFRRMAWRVTLRSHKPHVKVYQEEKEKPVWLAMDLSPSLFFGTKIQFKSVRSIKEAVTIGWSYLAKREKVGAIIYSPESFFSFKPNANEKNFLRILQKLTACSHQKPDYRKTHCFEAMLHLIEEQVRPRNEVLMFSDFYDFNPVTQKILTRLANRLFMHFYFVYDPLEAIAPPQGIYLVTNGDQKQVLNIPDKNFRNEYHTQFLKKVAELKDFANKNGIGFNIICTEQDV